MSAGMPDERTQAPALTGAPVYGVAALTILVLGVNWPVMGVGVELVPPLWLTSIRLFGAGVLVGAVVALRGRLPLPNRQDAPILLSVAVVRLALVYALVFVALTLVPPGRSSVLVYTSALWTAPLAAWLLAERFTALRAVGVLAGVGGVVLLVEPWTLEGTGDSALVGYAMLIGAAMATAIGTVHIRGHRWAARPHELMPYQLLLAGTLTALVAVAVEGAPRWDWDLTVVGIAGYQVVLASAFGVWGTLTIGRGLPALTASILLMTVPVIGVTSSAVLVGETLTLAVLGGMALIFTGVSAGVLSDRRATGAAPPS